MVTINYILVKYNMECRTKDVETATDLMSYGWKLKLSELGELL